LGDRLAEQPPSFMRDEVKLDRAPTCTLSIDGNLPWVPTKVANVFLDPSKGLNLVEEACVKVAVGRVPERRCCKKAKRRQPIIHRDDNDVWALVDPVVKGPIPGVAVDVTYDNLRMNCGGHLCDYGVPPP